MELNQSGPRLCLVSHRAPFLVPYCFPYTLMTSRQTFKSEIRLFADNCVCYREIKEIEDTVKLQKDIDRFRKLGQEMGYEISTCQTQHDAVDEIANT